MSLFDETQRPATTDSDSPALPSVLLEVAYDGTEFYGFAPQKTGRSVYDALLVALQRVDPTIDDVRVGAGSPSAAGTSTPIGAVRVRDAEGTDAVAAGAGPGGSVGVRAGRAGSHTRAIGRTVGARG